MAETAELQCITLRTLNKNITNSVIVGIIIRSQDVKLFFDKKDYVEKGVWHFTLRDSLTDYINITCWGSADYVINLKQKFCLGDIVDVMRPTITVRHIDDNNEKYRPSVTSPYNLSLNEDQASIVHHDGDNYQKFLPLLHYPTKTAANYLTLADIYNNGSTICGDYVDLLAVVQFVGPIKKLKAQADGRELTKRDVLLFDRTHVGLRIIFWEEEFIYRAEHWQSRETILLLSDMRVEWSNFEKSMVAVPNSKTIITEDPIIPQVETLREYAKTVPIHPISIADQLAVNIPDPSTINTRMTCKRILDLSLIPNNQHSGEVSVNNSQFTALLYAFVSELDLDGFIPVVITRCGRCNHVINETVNSCVNLACPVGSGSEEREPNSQFNIKVLLSDHTGSLMKCRLTGKVAEKVLKVSAEDFLKMSDDDKCELKWIYLLERCEVRILVLKQLERYPIISILDCKLATISDVSAKLPVD